MPGFDRVALRDRMDPIGDRSDIAPVGDRSRSWGFDNGFSPATWVGRRPSLGDSEGLLRGLGTDPYRSVGLVGLQLASYRS